MDEKSTRLEDSLHVAELARKASVTPATVRHYARIGLISSRKNPDNGYRCFSGVDVRRIGFVRQAQAFGLTIADIKRVFESVDNDDDPCELVKSMVEHRLTQVRQRIADLSATEARINQAILTWQVMGDPSPTDGELCPLVERLDLSNGDVQGLGRHLHGASMGRLGRTNPNIAASG